MRPGYDLETGALPELTGDDISLRTLRRTDAAAILDIFGDEDVVRLMDIALLQDLNDANRFIDDVHGLARAEQLFQWGIVSFGIVVGTCTLAALDFHNRRCELGFAVGSRNQGKGLATRAAELVIDHAFTVLEMNRVESWAATSNEASIKTLEKLGFVREGTLRERDFIDDQFVDSHACSLLASDWTSPRS